MSQERLHHLIVRMRIDTDVEDLLEASAKDQACYTPDFATRGQAVDRPIGFVAEPSPRDLPIGGILA